MHACMHVYVLKVPYIRRNSLQINYGVQFIVYHMWVCITCVCLKVPYIRRNSLQINYGVQFYSLCITRGCASHVCMPESSLHKKKFLTNKNISVRIVYNYIHACMHVHGCACITCVFMF